MIFKHFPHRVATLWLPTKFVAIAAIFFVTGLLNPAVTSALTECQKKVIDSGISRFNCEETTFVSACGGGSFAATGENAKDIMNFFVSKGYQPFQAAGIVGNMVHESGLQPQRLQGTKDGVVTPAESLSPAQLSRAGLGWGLVQFTPPGKFINTVTPTANANLLGTQVEFVWNQLEGNGPIPEKKAGDQLKATTNVQEAVLAFQGNTKAGGKYVGYERPGDQSGTVAVRTEHAVTALAQFGSGESGGGGDGLVSGGDGCGSEALDAGSCPAEPIDESQTVTVQGIRVHPCISEEVDRLITLARAQGLNMSGYGWRDTARQMELRRQNCPDPVNSRSSACSPPTAKPGNSNHERGSAVDFTCNGTTIKSRSHPCFTFLDTNTSLKNLPSEAWHWSINGN